MIQKFILQQKIRRNQPLSNLEVALSKQLNQKNFDSGKVLNVKD